MKENILLALRENIRLILGTVVVLFVLVILLTIFLSRQVGTTVKAEGETFKVKVAKTEKEKQVGLSETKKLGEKDGMLFVFNAPEKYSFWMRDMDFPIDIIYIKGDEVVDVIKNAPAPTSSNSELPIYQPSTEADKVLEVNSGIADKYNIKKGTKLEIANL